MLPRLCKDRGQVACLAGGPAMMAQLVVHDRTVVLCVTEEQQRQIDALKGVEVLAQWIETERDARLMWVREAARPHVPWTHERAQEAISTEWAGLLARLAGRTGE